MTGRADVLALEVATTSTDYAWEPSGEVPGATKRTLFAGQAYDAVPPLRRMWAIFRTVRHHDWVFMGLPYSGWEVILLTWALRLCGVRLVTFSESKADDRPRNAVVEWAKSAALLCYNGAIVGARRHVEYMRSLGFRRRPVLPGYDTVGVDRIRMASGCDQTLGGVAFEDRPFVFVGRWVDKKNLPNLVDAYAAYVAQAGPSAHRLVLAGSGPEEAEIRQRIEAGNVAHLVDLPGFLPAGAVAQLLADALALVLVSREEQWGLVVNEAIAFGLPVIVSQQVGSRDALVREGENGWVVDSESIGAIAAALLAASADPAAWERMVAASRARAWLGDTERLADAVESIVDTRGGQPFGRMAEFAAQVL
jgi:glycosyltransferase involved in cell wall biosynthesis